MTNEKILKRFKFELEVGSFNPIYRHVHTIYPFTIEGKKDFIRFSIILQLLGFKKDDNSTSFDAAGGISINMNRKVFWFFGDIPNDYEPKNFIPSYLYDYEFSKEEKELGVIKAYGTTTL